MFEGEKRKEVLDEWIKNKQKELYVVITPDWQGCEFEYPGWTD